MANERHRAQRIQGDFQKLLAELKKQDEELAELRGQLEAVDCIDGDVPASLARLFPEPEPLTPAQPSPIRATQLRGLVVRG